MKWILVSLFAIMFSFSAGAQPMEENPCSGDVKKFCPETEPGQMNIMKCLMQHKDELSAQCKEFGHHVRESAKEVKDACKDDAKKFCGDIQPGQGRIVKCMREHKKDLSATCQSEIESARKHRRGGRG